MINKLNFEKLTKKEQAKKILTLLDNLLLDITIDDKKNYKKMIIKLVEYLEIYEKLEKYLNEIRKYDIQDETEKFKNLKQLILEIRNEILNKLNLKNFESDYINYTKFGESRGKLKELYIILDNIRSPFNVGSIIRSAEAFGFKSVILYGISARLDNQKIYRTSMNAEKLIEIIRITEWENLKKFIEEKGLKIFVLEKANNSKLIWECDFEDGLALVIGNEEFGVTDMILENANTIIEIPQFGVKNSINVSCAFAIAASWISYKL